MNFAVLSFLVIVPSKSKKAIFISNTHSFKDKVRNNFYNKHNGAVLSVAINKYVYVIVKKHNVLFQENIRLNYSSTEHVKKINKIKNRIIRSCLELYPIQTPFYISIVSDIPSGTGLGSSGSITVGILKALHVIRNEKRTPRQFG